ncbi:MAG: pre-peptidase C-terminal domain-containing protein, partial [Caldilineaceae bacterium]|nr:pre-peptidase C-terminal domain-containing protein [Caldilineaceae bacterium]
ILIDGGVARFALASDPARDKLFMVDNDRALVSVDFDGRNRSVIVADANPDGVLGTLADYQLVAVDEGRAGSGGRVFWLQPYGDLNSTAAFIMRSNMDGSGTPVQIAATDRTTGLVVDQVGGALYWVNGTTIYRSDLDGNGITTVRSSAAGQQIYYLTIDPLARQLYWIDPLNHTLMRRSLLDGSEATLISGLGNAHGIVLRPERNELYYSNDSKIVRTALDGSNPVVITTVDRAYTGPSNLDLNTFPALYMAPPTHNMVLGVDAPYYSPCALNDPFESNNDLGSATPLTVITETVVSAALCTATLGGEIDRDYYSVSVPSNKRLTATVSQLPADYTLVVIHPDGYAAAFSNNPGLADETGTISNTTSAAVTYHVLVQPGFSLQTNSQYELSLVLGDVPPPPNPSDAQCGAVDRYDAPAPGGNGTLASATPLSFGTPLAAALCYSDDVDMYGFDGLAGQTVTIDLPTRPQDYNLTLYDPAGTPTQVISATTPTTYGDNITLTSSGRWTVAVSQPNLTPTTDQYQLLVTDQNCVASDANEPNNSASLATTLVNGNRVRATLCNSADVDVYTFSATSGQQLTLNYPANASAAVLRVVPVAGGADLLQVNPGEQGILTIVADGNYHIFAENNALASADRPYAFELLLGSPVTPPSGSPYIYYSRVSDLIRATLDGSTVEPLLLPNTFAGGNVLASDEVRGKLYILDVFERIVQVNPDGTNPVVVVADTGPSVTRFTESLAVDERSGRIYWTQATAGVVTTIRSA